ncbi:hypothetical protein JZU61_04175 [bacterium]|jgi:hypothetical protein|nr:hypothetical protein [bacterium]
MKEFLTVKEFLTATIAIYGAVLASFNFYREQQKLKRKIKVNLSTGYPTSNSGLGNFVIVLEFVNHGYKTVTVNSPELKLPDGKTIIMPNPDSNVLFPHSLEEGKNALVWIEIERLQKELINDGYHDTVKIKGAIRDQTGKYFRSKGWMKISLQRNYNT